MVITDNEQEIAIIIPIMDERHVMQSLIKSGEAHWAGGKPKGLKGLKLRGNPLSETVLGKRE